MKPEAAHTVAVIGAGIMGHGIAQGVLMAGYGVALKGLEKGILDLPVRRRDQAFLRRPKNLYGAEHGQLRRLGNS